MVGIGESSLLSSACHGIYLFISRVGYDARCAYPLVLFFHMADVDERYFIRSKLLREIDDLISTGQLPPAIVACPDGSYGGWNPLNAKHSLYVNGVGGRFGDHILQEIIPFLTANYSIRPEKQAHALVGFSAGGFGAMSLAIEYRNYFGAVATLSWTAQPSLFQLQ